LNTERFLKQKRQAKTRKDKLKRLSLSRNRQTSRKAPNYQKLLKRSERTKFHNKCKNRPKTEQTRRNRTVNFCKLTGRKEHWPLAHLKHKNKFLASDGLNLTKCYKKVKKKIDEIPNFPKKKNSSIIEIEIDQPKKFQKKTNRNILRPKKKRRRIFKKGEVHINQKYFENLAKDLEKRKKMIKILADYGPYGASLNPYSYGVERILIEKN
jgi:hypothetical protein